MLILYNDQISFSQLWLPTSSFSHQEPDDYMEWLQDVQATLIHGGWWKYVCPLPDFPTTDPNYIPYPDPLHAQVDAPICCWRA